MAYTTRQLINDAYYLSGIVSKSFESVSGAEIEDGLYRLNAFLKIKGAKTKLIPYFTVFEGQFILDQESYFIPNLVEIDTFSFFLTNPAISTQNAVRLGLEEYTRYQYLDVARPENVNAVPYCYYPERTFNGMNIKVYFRPQIPYFYQISGKFALLETTLNQDLSLIYDGWYIEYLTYGLAIYLCEWRNIVPATSLQKTCDELEKDNMTLGKLDFTTRTRNYFGKRGGLNWGDVNYGRGWR